LAEGKLGTTPSSSQSGERVYTVKARVKLADAADGKFLDVAIDGAADFLVIGNVRHFPPRLRHGIRVVSPRQWWDLWTQIKPNVLGMEFS
jgi:predicted nucleic acid-binding protein